MGYIFSKSGGSVLITNDGNTIYSGNSPMNFKINNSRIEVSAQGLSANNYFVVCILALADIDTIGGNAPAGTIEGVIVQLNALLGDAAILTDIDASLPQKTALNAVTPIDADAINVRPFGFDLLVAQDRIAGHSWVLKSGKNPDVDTANVPEDIYNGGGKYTGFPLTAPEVLQVFSSSALDTGVLTITYLPTATSTAYVEGTVTLNGTTPVDCAFSAYRVHSAYYTGASTGNAGEITVRWKVTTSVIFLKIPIGTNQSYSAVYTIPFGATGYLYEVFCSIQGGIAASVDGALWIRMNGMQYRLIRNFVAQTGSLYRENLNGAFVLPALTDITVRITSCTANNTPVVAGFTILVVQN